MALHTNNEFLMISTFHESLPECAVTWFYQLKNITCWRDLARAFLDRYQCNRKAATPPAKEPDNAAIAEEGEEPLKAPPPSNITTTSAEEEYAGPMVEGLSIHTIAGEGGFHHHTTDSPLPTGRGSQDVDLRAIATACLK
jgi:hypothetical protein